MRRIILCLVIGLAIGCGWVSPAGASGAKQIAGLTVFCSAPGPRFPFTPAVEFAIYNVPVGASLDVVYTVSKTGGPQQRHDEGAVPITKAATPSYQDNIPEASAPGSYTVSLTWTDGLGGGGSFGPMPLVAPDCSKAFNPLVQATPFIGMADTNDSQGYWDAESDGAAFGFGDGSHYGDVAGLPLKGLIVGIASTPDGQGYWLVGNDGGVYAFGDAPFLGSASNLRLSKPIVGMASTPDGNGYWLVAADGGVFTFGDAAFFGSTGAMHLNKPVVGIAPTGDGKGYDLAADDGGVFSFGDAVYNGSLGGMHLAKPVVGISADHTTGGYWLVGADGGVFAFDAPFLGSAATMHLALPVNGIAGTFDGQGYRLVAQDGGIFDYGDAGFFGAALLCDGFPEVHGSCPH